MGDIRTLFWNRKSQLELWFQSLNFSSLDFIRYTSFFAVGFLSGLFFKQWSKYIVLVSISVAIIFALLQGFSIVTINFTTIQKMTGLHNITNMKSAFVAALEIARHYKLEFSCSGLGFILGFKTG